MKNYQVYLTTGETFILMAVDYHSAFYMLSPKQKRKLLGIKEIF